MRSGASWCGRSGRDASPTCCVCRRDAVGGLRLWQAAGARARKRQSNQTTALPDLPHVRSRDRRAHQGVPRPHSAAPAGRCARGMTDARQRLSAADCRSERRKPVLRGNARSSPRSSKASSPSRRDRAQSAGHAAPGPRIDETARRATEGRPVPSHHLRLRPVRQGPHAFGNTHGTPGHADPRHHRADAPRRWVDICPIAIGVAKGADVDPG